MVVFDGTGDHVETLGFCVARLGLGLSSRAILVVAVGGVGFHVAVLVAMLCGGAVISSDVMLAVVVLMATVGDAILGASAHRGAKSRWVGRSTAASKGRGLGRDRVQSGQAGAKIASESMYCGREVVVGGSMPEAGGGDQT